MTLLHLRQSKTRFRAIWTPWTVWRHCLAPKGLQMAHFGTERGSRMCFFTEDRGPFGVLKSTFWAHFEAICGHFEAPFCPKPPWKAVLGSKGEAKKGQKCLFLQVTLVTPGCSNTCFGPFGNQKRVKIAWQTSPTCKNTCPLQLGPDTKSWLGLRSHG